MRKFITKVEKFLADAEAGKKIAVRRGCDALRELTTCLEAEAGLATVATAKKGPVEPERSHVEGLHERLDTLSRTEVVASVNPVPAKGPALVIVLELLKVALLAWLNGRKKADGQ